MKELVDYRVELERCETIIKRSLNTFIELGTALVEIRDKRLYRGTYRTFEAYCKKRWGWSRSYVYRQIDAANVAANLSPMGDKPTNERQLRPLSGLEPEVQRQVWTEAIKESNGQVPTGVVVERVRDRTEPPPKPVPDIDKFKHNLARDILGFMESKNPLLEQIIKFKDDLDDFARLDLVRTLEAVAERINIYAMQLYNKGELQTIKHPLKTVEGTRIN